MKELTIFLVSLLTAYPAKAAIHFDSKEYKPVGKHYTAKYNLLYYSRYVDLKEDRITLLYFTAPNETIMFKGFWISKPLVAKVPMAVIRYIGKYITNLKLQETRSIEEAIKATEKALDKALDKTWLDNLTNNSESFSLRNLYNRNYSGFPMNYYEFFPLEKTRLANPSSEVHDTTVLRLFRDSVMNVQKVLLEKTKKLFAVKDDLLKKPDFDKTISWQKYRYDNLMDVINQLTNLTYHHDTLKVSEWPLSTTKKWELYSNTPTGFHIDIDSTCKYLMILQPTLAKEQLMPAMAWKQNYGNWKATRCNLFVGDFMQEAFNLTTFPWGTKDWNASSIHSNLPSIKDFVSIDWDVAWTYANLGFPVVISTPKVGDAGHIAIAFPVDSETQTKIKDVSSALEYGKIVQAGSTNGLKSLTSGFGGNVIKSSGKVYIYLGYLNEI
jgi:hypothetical protein